MIFFWERLYVRWFNVKENSSSAPPMNIYKVILSWKKMKGKD